MKCPNCQKEMENIKAESYQYLESGLDNVVLSGIDIFRCACGEEIASIPSIDQLHTLIGLRLVKKDSLLNGKEIRFLRKNIVVSAQKLAKQMGVDNATISRWENDKQRITKSHDLHLRLIYCNMKRIPPEVINHLIQEEFPKVQEAYKEIPPYVIPQTEWSRGHQRTAQ